VLRACARLLRPGGRLAFFTIEIAPDLSPEQRRIAAAAGPPVAEGPDIVETLRRAHFVDVLAEDRSEEYKATARAWLESRLRHRDVIRPVAPAVYDDRIADGQNAVPLIEQGLLRRYFYLARKPD
jgi:cyclopropane fatty-acyl-phospholipid synthase-like methyltransferase